MLIINREAAMGASSPRFRVWLAALLVAAMLLLSPIPARAARDLRVGGGSREHHARQQRHGDHLSDRGRHLQRSGDRAHRDQLRRSDRAESRHGEHHRHRRERSRSRSTCREGAFEPGVVNEAGTTDEIEFAIDLGAGAGDSLTISGSPQPDLITMGGSGVNLNDADDIDLTTIGVKARTLSGVGGNDAPSAAGGNSTGSALVSSVAISGGNDSDSIIGGDGADTLNGDADADVIIGGLGSDTESRRYRQRSLRRGGGCQRF